MPLLSCHASRWVPLTRVFKATSGSVLTLYPCRPALPSKQAVYLTVDPAGSARTRFHSIVTAARAKDDLLKGIDPEHREDVARILDLADQAQATWTTVYTGANTFLHMPYSFLMQ